MKHLEKLTKFYFFKFIITKRSVDDMFHEILILARDKKYLSRYDDTKGTLHKYLSGFVFNYFCKIYKREHYVVEQASSLDKQLSGTEGVTLEESSIMAISPEASASSFGSNSSIFVEQIIEQLNKSSFSSFVVYTQDMELVGVFNVSRFDEFSHDEYIIYAREASTVLQLLNLGFTKLEIKDILKVSKSWITKMVCRIQSLPEVAEYAKELGLVSKNKEAML